MPRRSAAVVTHGTRGPNAGATAGNASVAPVAMREQGSRAPGRSWKVKLKDASSLPRSAGEGKADGLRGSGKAHLQFAAPLAQNGGGCLSGLHLI